MSTKNEAEILQNILLKFNDITPEGSRIFRNNTGQAYQGKTLNRNEHTLTLQYPRVVNFGLCKGSSDMIGFVPVKITQNMVGKTLSVFTALETKTHTGKLTEQQRRFLSMVNNAGGLGATLKCIDDLPLVIQKYLSQLDRGE